MAVAVVKWNDKALRSLVSAKEVRFLRRATAWMQRYAVQNMHSGSTRPSELLKTQRALAGFASQRGRRAERGLSSASVPNVGKANRQSRFVSRMLGSHAYANEFRKIVDRSRRSSVPGNVRRRVFGLVRTLHDRTLRSRPGQFPHRQTGTLANSITTDEELRVVQGLVNYAVARVGTNLAYGRYLEFGTSKMKARPWLRPSLAATKKMIRTGVFWDKA